MNKDKSLTIKRILIYIVLSFGITWLLFCLGDVKSIYSNPNNISGKQFLFAVLSMLGPALANFLTRGITKEDMQKSYLKFNIKGNFRYYVLSVVVIVSIGLVNGVISSLIYFGKVELNVSSMMFMGLSLSTISSAICTWIVYFGEEYGWRGYLYPKLEELLGTGKSIVIGGIIWALWHIPELLQGHNFGKDLPLFPISNIILMCIDCIFIGAFLTYITRRTNSIYPACISHSLLNNFTSGMVYYFIDQESDDLKSITQIQMILPLFIITIIVGTISMVMIYREKDSLACYKE